MKKLFPTLHETTHSTEEFPDVSISFLNERSQSLWLQLATPPPLQPPNWVQSRIRRLFLVSLGVPVDLDEILPASKQRKLVLPITSNEDDRSPAMTPGISIDPVSEISREQGQSHTTAASTHARPALRRGRPPPPPEVDLNSARLICSTTSAAMDNFTVEELRNHIVRLEELQGQVTQSQSYWQGRKQSADGDKAAFEEVIENLVKHAKKIRK